MEKTHVLFRIEKDNSILAVFPYMIADCKMNAGCYAHIGQHSACDYNYVISSTKPATESQYNDLKMELENIGYDLIITKRRNKSIVTN